MSIATPEGVDIDLTLAGVGSRFVATVIDQLIQWSILLGLSLLITLVGDGGGGGGGNGGSAAEGPVDGGSDSALFAVAIVVVFIFALQAGYHILFETFASGRTPGKRWTGLRVVTTGGGPVNFLTSVVRNLLRVIDFLPGFYGVAIVAVLASSRNQRLGDMAAGTLVVREPAGGREGWRARRRRTRDKRTPVQLIPRGVSSEEVATWDVSAVTADELATVRRFLDRRATLVPEARARLARDLAGRLRPKVVGPPANLHPEMFLEEVASAKAARL